MAKDKTKNDKLSQDNYKTKSEAVKAALAKVHKDYGAESAMIFVEKPVRNIEKVSTGSMGLDIALGIGGYARGRIIEIYGLESSGKTTLALHAIAEVQKLGGTAAFIDAEHALDPGYARNLGVDMDPLVISQPDSGEQALGIVETLVSSGGFDIIVVDSVAALVPQAEIDGEMGDHHVGTQARLMSQALRKLAGLVSKSNTILVFINQVRMKIGVMFGNPETTTGGNALKFYASQRLEVRRIGDVKDGEERVGNRTKVKIVKNKLAPPFREVEFDIVFGKGVDYYGELVDIGSAIGAVDKAGAWYSFAGERIGQGRSNAAEYLRGHEDAALLIDKAIRTHYRLNGEPEAASVSE